MRGVTPVPSDDSILRPDRRGNIQVMAFFIKLMEVETEQTLNDEINAVSKRSLYSLG